MDLAAPPRQPTTPRPLGKGVGGAPASGMAACMTRSGPSRRVLIASLNPGKVAELTTLARSWGLSPVSAATLGLIAPEEDGATFRANAEHKACVGSSASGLPALADDSGLVLPSQPESAGVHTARWAAAHGGYGPATAQLSPASDASALEAAYVCVLCYALPDGRTWFGEGRTPGRIVHPGRGTGPGLWPFFVPAGSTLSLAELDQEARCRVHPRGRASAALQDALGTLLRTPGCAG